MKMLLWSNLCRQDKLNVFRLFSICHQFVQIKLDSLTWHYHFFEYTQDIMADIAQIKVFLVK